jgi:hypothetical protein
MARTDGSLSRGSLDRWGLTLHASIGKGARPITFEDAAALLIGIMATGDFTHGRWL